LTPSRFTCPDCGQASRYAEDAGYGFCSRCGRYTGRCDAGRRFHFRGWLAGGGWHVPCARPWAAAWEIRRRPDDDPEPAKLCAGHGQAVSVGTAPVRGTRLAEPGRAPLTASPHRRRARVSRALRMAFGKLTEAELAANRARYLDRKQQKDQARQRRRPPP